MTATPVRSAPNVSAVQRTRGSAHLAAALVICSVAAASCLAISTQTFAQACNDCDGNGIAESVEQAAPSGLVGQYWRSQSGGQFTERLLSRIDPNIAFQWGSGSPDSLLPNDNFAVIWTGALVAPSTGTYTFWTTTDDGVRLWIGGALLINKWQAQSPTTWSASVNLVAGQRYILRMDYYEAGGGAEAKLEWQHPGAARQIVPTTALDPVADSDGDGWPDACNDCNLDGTPDAADFAAGTATDCNANCIPDSCEVAQSATLAYWRLESAGAVLADSGPNALDALPTGVTAEADVAEPIVPGTAQPNNGAVALGATGRFQVNDPNRILDTGGESFTIEAWVKLDQNAAAANADGRQALVQRKALGAGDKFADYIVYAQAGDMPSVGLGNYGRTGDFNGRELCIAFGTGGSQSSAFWTVTSNVRIDDHAWHFVSVSVDSDRGEVRFVLDSQVEHHAFINLGRVSVAAPLLVGTHTTSAGAYNQPLRGCVDEMRVSQGVIDAGLLLARWGSGDCNGNGTPDSCDILSGTSSDCDRDGLPDECEEDCNGNGSSDACDIAGGGSNDCNEDGVPDECQLKQNDCNGDGLPDDCQLGGNDCNENGRPDQCDIADGTETDCNSNLRPDSCDLGEPFKYQIDDGGAEFGIRGAGNNMAWLTGHRVSSGASTIEAIEIMFVFMPSTQPVTLYIWSDPNGDGDPSDAQVLASRTVPVTTLGVLQTIDLPDTEIGANGTSFFIGAITTVTTSDFPGALDTSGTPALGRSWIVGSNNTINPNNLFAGAIEAALVEDALPFAGKWMLRAKSTAPIRDCNGNSIVDSCEIDSGTASDVDGTGIPDECEDCNQNGQLDSVDITAGVSSDCQLDRIPDECQLVGFDCNQNGIPDACDIASGAAVDCNGNGIPDSCDIASGASADANGTGIPDECEDCNANGVLDTIDVSSGTSPDCNADQIPDECQLGEPKYTLEYSIDDGSREGNYGFASAVDVAWLNRYVVEPGSEWIGEIRVVLGNVIANEPYQVALWSDPDGNGSPSDAQLIATASAFAANGNTSIFNKIRINPTYVGPSGTSFFAGVLYTDRYGNQFPVGVDTGTLSLRTWVAAGPDLNPNDLSSAVVYGYLTQATGLVRAMGFGGGLPLDCNASGIPDSCEIADGSLNDVDGNGIPDCCEHGTRCKGCPADLNGDGQVGALDLTELLAGWGTPSGDVNGDRTTDATDLTFVLSNWGLCP
jgi:hypothetical protein